VSVVDGVRPCAIAQKIGPARHEHYIPLPLRQHLYDARLLGFRERGAAAAAAAAVDTVLFHLPVLVQHSADFGFVAFDDVEIPGREQGFHICATDCGRAATHGVEKDGAALVVVGSEGEDVICHAVWRGGAHVYDEGAVKEGEVVGFGAVGGHDGGAADGEADVGAKGLDDGVRHVVAEGRVSCEGADKGANGGDELSGCLGESGVAGGVAGGVVEGEWWWIVDAAPEGGGGVLWGGRGHDCADDSDAVETFKWIARLEEDTLEVCGVDAADADGGKGGVGGGEGGQDVAETRYTDDGFGVLFTVIIFVSVQFHMHVIGNREF